MDDTPDPHPFGRPAAPPATWGDPAAVTVPSDEPVAIGSLGAEASEASEASEAELLEGLEADLAAVEEAMRSLDRIAADGGGGDAAAAQIASVVSADRFPDGAPVAHVDLTGEPPRSATGGPTPAGRDHHA